MFIEVELFLSTRLLCSVLSKIVIGQKHVDVRNPGSCACV